jgi:hypothetical protein
MCYRGPDGHCLGLFCIYNIFSTIKKATLSNGRRVKENGGGTVAFRATQEDSEEVLGILKMCAKYEESGRVNLQHNQQLQANTFVVRYINPVFIPLTLHRFQIGFHST